ncbi:uncharacterized protein LOC143029158 [Oratosquilla oratoria]|uniref:uncharacterized protein LOC143029158 n=1 Tax=Oratosquilla oratoria TaxID=337810 RepID=UPI003F77464A
MKPKRMAWENIIAEFSAQPDVQPRPSHGLKQSWDNQTYKDKLSKKGQPSSNSENNEKEIDEVLSILATCEPESVVIVSDTFLGGEDEDDGISCDMNAFHMDSAGPLEPQSIETSQPVFSSQYSASPFASNNMSERTSSNTAKALVYTNNRYNQGTAQNKSKMPIPIAPALPTRFSVSNTPTIFTVPASLFSTIMNNNAGCSGVNSTPVSTVVSGAPIASAMIGPQSSPSVIAPQPAPMIAQTPGKPLLAPKSSSTLQPIMNSVPSSNMITSPSSGTMINPTPGKPLLAPKTISSLLTPITLPAVIAPKTTHNVIPPSSLQTVIAPKTAPAVTLSTSAIVSPISATTLINPTPGKPLLAPKATPGIIPQTPIQSIIAPTSSNVPSSPLSSSMINPSPGMPLIAPKPSPNILPASAVLPNSSVASALNTPSPSTVTPTMIATQPSQILPTGSSVTTSCTTSTSIFSTCSTSSLEVAGLSGTSYISNPTSLPSPTSCKLETDNSGISSLNVRHPKNVDGFGKDESDTVKKQVLNKLKLEKIQIEKVLAEEKLKFLRESHRMRVEEFEMRKMEYKMKVAGLKRKQEEAEEERKMRREEYKQKMQLLALQKEQLRNSQHEV